jgi:hypothetical protein
LHLDSLIDKTWLRCLRMRRINHAQIDLSVTEADPTAAGDRDRSIVERVFQVA